jgi:formyl-CoA transferase
MDMVRADETADPARSVPGMGDHPSATALYAAIITALYRREKTGKGGIAQSSLLQNGTWANPCFIQSRLFGEPMPLRQPRNQAPNPLANHYRCRDGRWFLMALFNEQRQLRGFLAAIGGTHLADDARFATSAARKENSAAFVAILDEVFAQRDLEEWRTIPGAAGVTFGVVHSVDETASDAQVQNIGALVPLPMGTA